MISRWLIKMKMASIRCSIDRIERDIVNVRADMILKNQVYYAGLGDVDQFLAGWLEVSHNRIKLLDRLLYWYQIRLDRC